MKEFGLIRIALRVSAVGDINPISPDLAIQGRDLHSEQARGAPLSSTGVDQCVADQLGLETPHLNLQIKAGPIVGVALIERLDLT
jgi:hypothetical protein